MKKQIFYKTMRNQNGKGYYLEEAQHEINSKIKTLFKIWDTEAIQQARRIKFNLICQL